MTTKLIAGLRITSPSTELAVLPFASVGVNLAYNRLEVEEAVDWTSAGLQGAVTF